MKTFKHVVPVAVAIMLIAGLAQAGSNTRTLSVFPHTHKVQTVNVPVVTGVDEDQCIINVSHGECSAAVDFDVSNLNPICHWQQDEFKCIKGHWEKGCKPKYVCDEYAPDSRKEWCVHCTEPVTLEGLFADIELDDEDIQCTPTTVSVDCPSDSVQYDTVPISVGYEELVTEAFVGDIIDIRGTIWTNRIKYVGHRFLVFKVYPNKTKKLLYKAGMRMGYSGGTLEDEFFYIPSTPGIHRFELRVFKSDGTMGSIWAKVLVKERVTE